jgi:hypothetical protein
MTLSFSTHLNGQPTEFVEKIWKSIYIQYFDSFAQEHFDYSKKMISRFNKPILVSGVSNPKIHTIRNDNSNRWKPGNMIHFVINNRTPDRFQFAPVLECKGVQKIDIVWSRKFDGKSGSVIVLIDEEPFAIADVWDYCVNHSEDYRKLKVLANNDGFSSVLDFLNYFNQDFSGKIIHWTNHKYKPDPAPHIIKAISAI